LPEILCELNSDYPALGTSISMPPQIAGASFILVSGSVYRVVTSIYRIAAPG